MPEQMITTDGARHVPPVAISATSTLVTRTGSWKYQQPAYHDRVAPCNARCPVGIDIEGYLNCLREGRVDDARDLLLMENPMPAVTGRVCHHPCETACNRRVLDGAVAIHAVERAMGDFAHEHPAPVLLGTQRAERVAVIGSGPAGLAAAYHLARFGYGVTIFEAHAEAGGMLRLGIPTYRLPREVLDKDIARITAHRVEIKCGVKVGVDISWNEIVTSFDAVVVSTGAHTSRALGVPGEQLDGVRPGLAFLREVNAGQRPVLGANVIVVGGGNTAMDCARSALRLGAKVTVVYRRTRDEMPAIREEIEDAAREGAEFVFLANPAEFTASNGRVSAMVCERMALGEADASGRRRPVSTGETYTLPADTVLTAIGESSALEGFLPNIEGSDSGLRVDALGGTSRDLLFAGGDVTDLERTVADALGAGKRAAIGIDRHLRHHHGETAELNALRFAQGNLSATRWLHSDPITRIAPLNETVGPDDLNLSQFRKLARHNDPHLAADRAVSGFDEVNAGLTTAEAMDEAQRCFNCGVCTQCDVCMTFCPDAAITQNENGYYTVAMDYCKGCGLCAAECPRGAITMTQDRP